MRLWLDPIRMASYNITPMDVKNALDRENIELPAGSIEGDQIEQSIRTMGLMSTPEDFNNLILKEDNFRIVRFRDVGFAELDAADRQNILRRNGVPMVSAVIIPQPGANHINIADEVRVRMEQMQKDLPEDVILDVAFDNTKFIRASISEVQNTVIIAFLLVVFIIFVFLRNLRVTLIPAVVIPISLIGIFFVMYLAGFSINVLSMLAIVLAVGLVVDDAIVVTENIFQKVENGLDPIEASIAGSKEIFFAVVSTTITLVAVFFPIVFLEGMTGRLFREFSIVIAGAVAISSFVALTFTPMLSTKLLKSRQKHNRFYNWSEKYFVRLNNIYKDSLESFLRRKYISLFILIGAGFLIFALWSIIPAEMAPLEDRSQFNVNVSSPEGATYEFNYDYVEEVGQLVNEMVPEANKITTLVRGSWAFVRAALVDPSE